MVIFIKKSHLSENNRHQSNFKLYTFGLTAGFFSGLLGAGGGMIIVPLLRRYGLPTKKVHATSVSIILPICALSAVIYLVNKRVTFVDAIPYIPSGIVGAMLGSKLLQKLHAEVIRKIFGIVLLWAGIKMLF